MGYVASMQQLKRQHHTLQHVTSACYKEKHKLLQQSTPIISNNCYNDQRVKPAEFGMWLRGWW